MDKFINPDLLQDNADSVEEMSYVESLSEEEMIAAKDEYANKSIIQSRMEDEEKERRDEYKEKIKPIKHNNAILLNEIKNGVRDCYGRVYLLSDQAEGMMGYYSEKGQLIHKRPLTQDERQLRISKSVNE